MTYSRHLPSLTLDLVPMHVAQTVTQPVASWQDPQTQEQQWLDPQEHSKSCDVVVYPGEPSELLVSLDNTSGDSLTVEAEVQGDFPEQWCQFSPTTWYLAPGETQQVSLYFYSPEDSFEQDNAYPSPATLDFKGRFLVTYWVSDNRESQQVSGSFNLYQRPRSLYLNFLPELYREVDFIGRLLAIFEQSFEPIVQSLDNLWAYLDPRTAPESLLPFLAYWVGWQIDPYLSLTQQRYLIRYAIELYRWRGTRRGLRFYLYLYTHLPLDDELPEADKHISIQEIFSQGLVIGQTHLGETAIVGGGQPYHFTVTLRSPLTHPIDEPLIRKIINQEKPAFCTYDLTLEPESDSHLELAS